MSAPSALYSTTKPTPAVMKSSRIRGTSTTSPPNGRQRPAPVLRPHSRLASDIALRGEIRVHDLAHDRRGGTRAGAAVLDDDGDGNARRVGRRVGGEPAVIAQPLVHVTLFVLFVLAHGEHLRGAGFAGDLVVRALHRLARRAVQPPT